MPWQKKVGGPLKEGQRVKHPSNPKTRQSPRLLCAYYAGSSRNADCNLLYFLEKDFDEER